MEYLFSAQVAQACGLPLMIDYLENDPRKAGLAVAKEQ